jgi:hypothetical protein
MRLSALVIAAIPLISLSLLAQHSSAGGGATSGGGHSGAGSSGGSFHGGSAASPGSARGSGMASSSTSSSSRRNNSSSAGSARSTSERSTSLSERSPKDPVGTGLNISPNLLKSAVSEKPEAPEKKSVFSFLHHKKPAPETAILSNPPFHCKKGQSCGTPTRAACQTGRIWNSSSCSQYDQYSWFNSCRSLADQLAMERERMGLGNDPGESVRYQMMLNQYRQCMRRYGSEPFSSYLFTDASVEPYF